MSVSKNWKAIAFSGVAGNEIIVTGDANVGPLDVLPKLEKRVPQGINGKILLLDLLNAVDDKPESFKPVQFNEKIGSLEKYASVEVFNKGTSIAKFDVTITK